MATSKRKESAALFELIDKSTLKVPRNASALKIPNWWSSKTNPASATAVAPGAPPRTRSQAAVVASMAPLVKSPVGVVSSPAAPTPAMPQEAQAAEVPVATFEIPVEAEPEVAEAPAQARLFDPPPPHVAPASSPSIRPPSANGHAVVTAPPQSRPAPTPTDSTPEISPDLPAPLPDAAVAQSPAEPAATAEMPVLPPVENAIPSRFPPAVADLPIVAAMMTAPALPRSALQAPSSPPAQSARAGAPSRVFAPQTYSQDRKAWSSPRPGAFARLPGWAILTAGAALVILICVVVLIAKTVGKTTTAPAINKTVLPTGTGPTVAIGRGNSTPPAPSPGSTLGARIYAGGTVPYKSELYYVIICSTRLPATANDYALYLQKNGIDVAIETIQGNEFPYTLVATRGFASASLAKPYRDTIVHIGDTLSRGVWKDANPQKGLRGLPTGG